MMTVSKIPDYANNRAGLRTLFFKLLQLNCLKPTRLIAG